MTAAHPALTAFGLAGLDLRNRLAVAPTTRASATAEGLVTTGMTACWTPFDPAVLQPRATLENIRRVHAD
ncbi:hypothetical protein [Streptomyces triticisoli]|uniref:hypothetical protein n=1 Tax=Streptomyces triticisoli TaxID=2182797 RepID=UPI0018E4FCEC|nr:hypothetical protein [Streptomyces triticisoli]